MKTKKLTLLAAALLLLTPTGSWSGEKARLGPCVRQCIQGFNPLLADSGAEEFMAEGSRARECVRSCKETLYQGECDATADGCCNPDYLATDPDCQDPEPPEPPDNDGLPPDPGEAGKTTLGGIDSDDDGLRDDIQRYIFLHFTDSAKTRAALRQAALALQNIILNSPDEAGALRNTELEARASECIRYICPDDGRRIDNMLLAEFLNTEARSRAYLAYDAKLSGHVFGTRDLDQYKTSCTFDPDQLED
jgi:hypothetical protein